MSPAARRSPQRTIKGSICIFPRGDNSISMNLMSICGRGGKCRHLQADIVQKLLFPLISNDFGNGFVTELRSAEAQQI